MLTAGNAAEVPKLNADDWFVGVNEALLLLEPNVSPDVAGAEGALVGAAPKVKPEAACAGTGFALLAGAPKEKEGVLAMAGDPNENVGFA